jgi:hypothetical protein
MDVPARVVSIRGALVDGAKSVDPTYWAVTELVPRGVPSNGSGGKPGANNVK